MYTTKETFDVWNENKRSLHIRDDIDRFYIKPKEI